MRKRFIFGIAAGAVAALASGLPATAGPNGSDQGTSCVLNTQLLPENERRINNLDPVDSTAKGHAQVKVRNDGTIEWNVFILNRDEETFVAGHIHRAPETAPGPVVQPTFTGPPSSDRQFRNSGEVSNPVLAADLCANPQNYYVNYHTTQDPQGAVRGQLG